MSYNARLNLIRDTLAILQEESTILASPEDVLYFRTLAKNKTPHQLLSRSSNEPNLFPKKLDTSPIPQGPEEQEPPETPPPPSAKSSFTPKTPLEINKETSPNKNGAKKTENLHHQILADPVQEPSKQDGPPWRSEASLSIEPLNFSSLKSLFQKTFPQLALPDEIPSDETAKKIAHRWKTKNQIAPISILHFSEPPKQKALLGEIVKAIDIYFGPARLINAETIEKEKQWETFLSSNNLKLVIACDYTLWQLSDLMRHYKEVPSQQTRNLANIPLFLLPDLSLYLKDPLLKRSLWKAICHRLST
jgi:hypothetical protein